MIARAIISAITLSIFIVLEPAAHAQTADQIERAQALYKEIRCPVCVAQSISESDAGLSKNIREKIINEIVSGKSDDEIITSLTTTYGDDIHLRPKKEARTLVLWTAPWGIIVVGALAILSVHRRRRKSDIDLTAPPQ